MGFPLWTLFHAVQGLVIGLEVKYFQNYNVVRGDDS
jgi:hypothetical protein